MIVYRIAVDPWADKLSFRYDGRDEVSRDLVVVVVLRGLAPRYHRVLRFLLILVLPSRDGLIS